MNAKLASGGCVGIVNAKLASGGCVGIVNAKLGFWRVRRHRER